VERVGTLRDLSAGGLAVVSQCYYEEGEDVVVHFRPSDYLPRRDQAGPELQERMMSGAIVETERLAGGRCLYHVNFPELDAEERRYLFRLVHRLELAARE
jgi:c-di-GMP-binding flagellar brake protein YcgR